MSTTTFAAVTTVAVPVTDQDRSKALLEQLGFETRMDAELQEGFRWVELGVAGVATTISLVRAGDELTAGVDTGIRSRQQTQEPESLDPRRTRLRPRSRVASAGHRARSPSPIPRPAGPAPFSAGRTNRVAHSFTVVVAVGADACKSGWITVVVGDAGVLAVHYLPGIASLPVIVPDASVVAIDIPIGLPVSGRREADLAARSLLGARRNSVFFTPIRAAVEAASHADATATSVRLTGLGLSRQSFALAPKLLEVDTWIRQAPCPVYEVHPEVSFAILLGAPASAPKKSWAGMSERRRALELAGLSLDEVDGEAADRAAVDDMLDAAVAAWSARRIVRRQALTIPDPAPVGPDGRPVAIWA